MNAILVFFWHGTATTVLNAVYWQAGSPPSEVADRYTIVGGEKGIVGFRDRVVCSVVSDGGKLSSHSSPCQLVFVLIKITCFCLACWLCARHGYFWKL